MSSSRPTQSSPSPDPALLKNWSLYGPPATSPPTPTLSSERMKKTISNPLKASWKIPILSEQVLTLLNGFQPESMDDRWAVWSEGPDERGRCKIVMCRSWTGHRIFEVEVKLKRLDGGNERGSKEVGGWITGLVWEENKDVVTVESERDAKRMVRGVCKGVLGVELGDAEG